MQALSDIRGELTMGAKGLVVGTKRPGGRLGGKRLGEEMVWERNVPDLPKGVSTQLQSSGLVAHEKSTLRNLALAVSGPFMA